jgi:hypothetical protein
MRVMGDELNLQGLPRPIPADELQEMLGRNEAFCSWDASISKVSEEMARWPFLFSDRQQQKLNHRRRRDGTKFKSSAANHPPGDQNA